MSKILIASLKQETATFNPTPTRYEDFQVTIGETMLETLSGTDTEIAGALDVFAERKLTAEVIEPVGGMAGWSVSGGRIVESDLDRLIDEFLDEVRRHADTVDAAYLCLHGAMAGETEVDPEGRVLAETRSLLGDRPLVASLDLHAVLTDRMLEAADILVPFHTYPHVDQYSTGQRAAGNLLRLLGGEVSPTTSRISLPMLVRGDELITETGLFGKAIRDCHAVEESDVGLAAGVLIGNPFTDVPALQSHVLVTTDSDPAAAAEAAERIARFMWEHRERFVAELVSLDAAITAANRTEGLAVFSDAADATASGASGDSNLILAGLLGRHPDVATVLAGRALVPIVDAPAATTAVAAGVGATVNVNLGGTRDPGRFTPLEVTGEVLGVFDGEFAYESGVTAHAGATAVLRIGSTDVLVTERSIYVVGRRVYESHGLDPRDYDAVVVKSPNGFRTHYESIAAAILPVDVPGSTSANLKSLPFRHCVRPIFPLDTDVPDPFGE